MLIELYYYIFLNSPAVFLFNLQRAANQQFVSRVITLERVQPITCGGSIVFFCLAILNYSLLEK